MPVLADGGLQALHLAASYLNRSYGLAVDHATDLAATVIIAGIVGTVAFAHLADRVASRDPRGRLRVPPALSIATLGLLTGASAMLPAGPPQIALIIAGGLTATAAVGPVAAVVADVVHPGLRATAISTVSVAQILLGLRSGRRLLACSPTATDSPAPHGQAWRPPDTSK